MKKAVTLLSLVFVVSGMAAAQGASGDNPPDQAQNDNMPDQAQNDNMPMNITAPPVENVTELPDEAAEQATFVTTSVATQVGNAAGAIGDGLSNIVPGGFLAELIQ